MALINNIYVLAADESVDNEVATTSHPTETGLPLSDTVRRQPITISLTGKIVDTDKLTAKEAVKKLKSLQEKGSLISYVGQAGAFSNLQIQTFTPNYNNKNYGGADFDMTLKEVRIAKSAYVKPTVIVVKPKPKNIAVGDTVNFTGGYVYVASDARTPASKRGKSTCKLTKISTLANARYKYHIISVDGRCVYGWVHTANVHPITKTTSSSSNGGTQQVSADTTKHVYYSVKRGDTLWSIVNKKYPSLNLSITEIAENNPHAFKEKGMYHTLIVGSRLMLK